MEIILWKIMQKLSYWILVNKQWLATTKMMDDVVALIGRDLRECRTTELIIEVSTEGSRLTQHVVDITSW